MRIILWIVFIFSLNVFANAQPGTTVIKGTVAENANLELSVFKKSGKIPEKIAEYKVFAGSPEFAFTIPVEKGAKYSLFILVMEQGHRRLEIKKGLSFPIQLKQGQNLSMKITPSALDTVKKKGIEIKNNTEFPSLAFISGNVVNGKVGVPISLQKVGNGNLEEIALYNTSVRNRRFQVAIPVKEEGFYYVAGPRFRCRVYLKPIDELELNINAFSGDYDVISGSEENQLVGKWQKLSLPITDYGYNRTIFQNDSLDLDKYIATYQKLQPAIADFRVSNKLANEKFNKLFDQAITVDNEFAPLYLLSCLSAKKTKGYASAPKNFNNPPAFYKQFIQPGKFSDASILRIGEAMSFIGEYQKLNFSLMPETAKKNLLSEDKMKIMMDVITNDTIKAYFLKDQMGTVEISNLSEFREIYQPFEKYTFIPAVKKKFDQVYEQFIGDTAFLGKSSYDFSLPDTSGKMVSMKDFKGKVIFIDVWATWCGPCRGQIPYLKEIEEEYKGNKDIVFMGISLDKIKDRQKWIDFIRKEDLHGVQLLDDIGLAFGRKYQINSIPRFLLIDKQGNWLEIRCPMPDTKEKLKRYLDKALNENSLTANAGN